MRVDNSTGKGTSGMDKFSSKVHRLHMELGGNLVNSWSPLRCFPPFFISTGAHGGCTCIAIYGGRVLADTGAWECLKCSLSSVLESNSFSSYLL